MESPPASAGFPFAIRARLSTEDSSSDASSFISSDSDDNSGIDGLEEAETEEDNAASLRRPFMPIARITGDDEDDDDDVLEGFVFDDEDEEEEVNPKLAVETLVAESSVDEVWEKGKGYVDEPKRMAAPDDDTGDEEGGLELNDAKVAMDIDFGAVVYDKIGDVGYGDVKQSKGFDLELKSLVVDSSIIDSEKSNLFVSDIDSSQNSVMEAELRTLRAEAQALDLIVPEVEDNPVEIVKFEASGAITSSQVWNEEADAKTEEAEFDVVEDMGEKTTGYIDSKSGLFVEKMLEVSEVEADSTESEVFEAPGVVGVSHSQILEMVSLHDDKAFEPKHPEVCVNMEAEKDKDLYRKVYSDDSEKAKDSTGKLLILTGSDNDWGNSSSIKDVSAEKVIAYPTEYLDNFKEKNDESGAVKEVSIAENYSACELSSENFSSFYAYENEMESSFDSYHVSHYETSAEEDELVISEWPARFVISENSESVKHTLREMEEGSETSRSYLYFLDGQTISNSGEEGETDEDGNAKELFDTSALASLLRASSGTSSSGISHFTSQDTSSVNDMNDEEKTLHLKVEKIRVKYLCLAENLGYSADDALPDHVLHRMSLIDPARQERKISEEFSPEIDKKVALQLDEDKDDFTFSCNILVLGKTGVGKSAAINSIFGEERAFTDPFQPATTSVREISGVVDGVYIRIIDTPGLLTSLNDQSANRKILSMIKKYIRRCPPDVVLYVDRLDAYNHDSNELPLFRMITSILGSSIWLKTIIALTHADLAFPDGPDGSSMSYEMVVARRSKVVQQLIWRAADDSGLTNSVALVESHFSCRKNMDGESILPNGLRWRPWLLLLCYSCKVLSELNSFMKLEFPSPKKLFPFQWLYFLPAFLSSLMQSKFQEGDRDNHDSDFILDNLTEEEIEEEIEEDDEDDQLSFFKPLRKPEVQNLTKVQKNAYFDKRDYPLKPQKKKREEELKRFIKIKSSKDAVAVPLSDVVLPPSFDGGNPTYLYQFLEPRPRLFARPVQHTHSWDHDSGYDGVSIEESIDIAPRFPMSLAVKISKDKKEFSINLNSSIESKHGENASTPAIFNIQPIRKQMAYSLPFETNLRNLKKKKKKTGTGISATFSGETLVNEFKLEDQISLGKKLCLVASTGMIRVQRNMAYGVNLEVCFMEKDYPIEQVLSTCCLSMIKWRDFSVGANLQSEFSTGRNSKMEVCVGLNSRNNGQISIKTSATDQVHITLLGLLSLALSIYRSNWNSKTS